MKPLLPSDAPQHSEHFQLLLVPILPLSFPMPALNMKSKRTMNMFNTLL